MIYCTNKWLRKMVTGTMVEKWKSVHIKIDFQGKLSRKLITKEANQLYLSTYQFVPCPVKQQTVRVKKLNSYTWNQNVYKWLCFWLFGVQLCCRSKLRIMIKLIVLTVRKPLFILTIMKQTTELVKKNVILIIRVMMLIN